MRGGYRVGSGPRKGAKYKTRSGKNVPGPELTPEERGRLRILLLFIDLYKDGGKLTCTEMKWLEETEESLKL